MPFTQVRKSSSSSPMMDFRRSKVRSRMSIEWVQFSTKLLSRCQHEVLIFLACSYHPKTRVGIVLTLKSSRSSQTSSLSRISFSLSGERHPSRSPVFCLRKNLGKPLGIPHRRRRRRGVGLLAVLFGLSVSKNASGLLRILTYSS